MDWHSSGVLSTKGCGHGQSLADADLRSTGKLTPFSTRDGNPGHVAAAAAAATAAEDSFQPRLLPIPHKPAVAQAIWNSACDLAYFFGIFS